MKIQGKKIVAVEREMNTISTETGLDKKHGEMIGGTESK